MVVGGLSNTQRISLKYTDSGVSIQKEFRKDSSRNWTVSKGIEIPREMIDELIKLLKTS